MQRAEASKENVGGRGRILNVHYFSTFFWSKLKTSGYEKGRLAKWTKAVRISLIFRVLSLTHIYLLD